MALVKGAGPKTWQWVTKGVMIDVTSSGTSTGLCNLLVST